MHLINEEDLRSTVLNAPIGICILNAETFVAELLNDKFLEVAGKPREDIIGHWYWKPFAEAKDYYEEALINVVKTGEPFYADEVKLMLIRHGKKEHIFVTFVYAPVTDAHANVSKVAVWVLENTRQVKARHEIDELNKKLADTNNKLQTVNTSLTELNTRLQESETNFIRLVEQAPVAILVFNGPDLIINQANQAMLELLGKDTSIIGQPLLDGLPEIKGAAAVDQLFHVFNTGVPSDGIEQPVPIKRNGKLEMRYFNFSYRPLLDNGKIIGVMDIAVEVTAQVLAREQANEQKRVYETITSGTPDLMYVWDLDYNFTYVNSALLNMWGKTWDTAVGKGLRENGYEEWHAQMHEREIDHVVATKESVRGEVSFPHAVLGKRIYDYILIPVLGDNGDVVAVAGTTRDVTERKQMEEDLAASQDELQAINEELATTNEEQAASNEELTTTNNELAVVNQRLADAQQKIEENQIALRLAIEAADFGTWFIHSETREFITDARLKELFGYLPDEDLSIEQALAQITDEYRAFVTTKLENAIYHNGDYDVTYPVIGLHDGQLRWLRAIGNLKADPSGAFSAFTGVVMDITEQHLAAQKAEDSEKHFRYLADLVPAKISNALPNGEVTFFNRQWLEYAGMSFEDLRDFGYYQMMHPDEIAGFRAKLAEGAAKGVAVETEMRFKDKSGNYRWHLNISSPILNEKGEITMWVGSTTDIERIKEEDQRKNDFIGMVSHELKTPLTSLSAIIQVAAKKLKNSEDQFIAGAMEKATVQVKRMSTMINGFLNVSRLESAQLLIVKKPFDLSILIREIVAETELTVSSHDIKLSQCNSVMVIADQEKINSVVTNLISNAIKYSPKGKLVEIKCQLEGDKVVVSVRDEGMGLKPSDKEKVFARYFRVESDRTQHISGFGIGLYLSAEIINRHNGEIWVESESGIGSTFYFTLPLN